VPGDVGGEAHVLPTSGFPVIEEALAGLPGDDCGKIGSGLDVEIGMTEACSPHVVFFFI
jgi:hypothetical protein